MLYIYKDWTGNLNAICDGTPAGKFTRKIKTDRFGNPTDYVIWDQLYGYDRERNLRLYVRCVCMNQKAANISKHIRAGEKLLVFGDIKIDKERSERDGCKRYVLFVSSMIPIIELYRLIEKNHSEDDIEARVMAEYRKKSRKANEINLMGEAEKILSAEDVML